MWWLDHLSFWQDEGYSVAASSAPLSYIVVENSTAIPNPPLYFLLLHFWWIPAGHSEFAIRFLSVIPAVLVIPLVWLVGRALVPGLHAARRSALIAAALVCCSPFLVWFAQEARMYSLALLLATLSVYLLVRALRRGRWCDWLGFAAANVLAAYSHPYSFFVTCAEGAVCLWHWMRAAHDGGDARPWRRAVFCTIAAGLMFAPWVLSESALSGGASSWHGFVDALGIVQVLGSNFASDDHLPAAIEPAFNALLLVLVVAGAAVLLLRLLGLKRSCGKPPPRFGVALTLVWLILPLALVYAISLRQPLFSPRYFIVALPPYLLLAAVALAALPRAAGAGLVGMLAAGSVWAVVRANTVPQYAKEDFRLAAHYISQRSQADDVIGLLANYTVYPFEYYFEGAGRVVPVDVQPDSDITPLVAELVSRDHIWLVEAHDVFVDPQNRVAEALRERYVVEDEKYITGIHFLEFATHPTVATLPSVQAGGALGSGPPLAAWQTESRAGGELVTLYWPTTPHAAADFHLSLKLWAGNGKLAGQQDGEPLNAGLPFTKFPATGFVRDEHFLDAPPGTYDLRLSMYPPGGADVGQLDLGQVTVGS